MRKGKFNRRKMKWLVCVFGNEGVISDNLKCVFGQLLRVLILVADIVCVTY
jgi:roadblock/LC7 domain-containing protein